MTLKASFSYAAGAFRALAGSLAHPVAEAGTSAVREASERIKREGRASIGQAGFSQGWQNALRVELFPKSGAPSIDAATYVWHKIPYAGIYEEGGEIEGDPYLWVPLRNAPQKIGRYGRMTPKLFRERVGPLFRMPNTSKPILAARIRANRRPAKVSLPALRRGVNPGGKGRVQAVPIFVGIPRRSIPKRFDVQGAVDRAGEQLPALFTKHFRED